MNGIDSEYGGACRKDTPYPSVSQESVPSLIDNLTTALYGQISKVVVNRRVQWVIPCDPVGAPATVFGVTRNAGEGLLCYFIRAFNAANNGGSTFYGSFVGPLSGNATSATNITGGAANSIPYQTAINTTALLPAGTNGQVLGLLSGVLTWVSAPASSTSSAIAGGAAGQVLWQVGSSNTGFTAAGTAGQVLSSNGTSSPSWLNAVNTNTASAIVRRDGSGNFAAGTITASLVGNADTATKLAATKTIATTGDVTGTATAFDGSANISIPTTITAGSVTAAKLSTGGPSWDVSGNLTATSFVGPASAIANGAVSTTAKIADGVVTAAKLGTNEQKQIAKAWVNFVGLPTAVTGKSYTRTTTTVTVTSVAHGLATGNTIVVSSATDTGVNGTVVITVTGVDAFTFVTAATGANGTLSYTLTIRSSYSVSSITRNGTGDYTINLSITMADLNYVMVGSNSNALTTTGSSSGILAPYTKTTTTCRILTNAANTPQESQEVDVVIFGN